MKKASNITAMQRRLEALGVPPTTITMGRKFHDELRAELESTRMFLQPGDPITTIASFNGLEVIVDDSAPEGQAWIGVPVMFMHEGLV